MKISDVRRGAPSADDLAAMFRAARGEFMKRRARYLEMGAGQLEKSAQQLEKRSKVLQRSARGASWQARRDLAERIHPAPGRGRLMMLLIGVTVGACAGYALADRRNRERLAEYARNLADRARPVMESAGTRLRVGEPLRAAEESALLEAAQGVLAGQGGASGLKAAVEGRTVYLRGQAPAAVSQEVAEKLRALPGAAAVVNLSMATTAEQVAETSGNQAPAPSTSA